MSADVVLRCQDERGGSEDFKCHKVVLTARSSRFREVFDAENFVQKDGIHFLLLNHDAKHCSALVWYIYTGIYPTTEKDIWRDHIICAQIGQEYHLPQMEDKALAAFAMMFRDCDLKSTAIMLGEIDEWCDRFHYESDKLQKAVNGVCSKYVEAIIADPALAICTNNDDIMKKCLENITQQPKSNVGCRACGASGTLRTSAKDKCTEDAKEGHVCTRSDMEG